MMERKQFMERKAWPYRGFMLDPARHFLPVDDVCRVIEAAAACGMNRMHWHLTDDQGWRLEIKKYPLLTQVGAFRGASYFSDRVSETENNCGFYTQQEVRDIVAFAKEKGVEIVPEIEVGMMVNSEVAVETTALMPYASLNKGTIIMPPPTPSIPEMMPMTTPIRAVTMNVAAIV